jgi:hypothetical protein
MMLKVTISDFFLAKNRQMATQFSENGKFCGKFPVFEKKSDRKLAFCGWYRHIYASWLQFSEFLEINSPVKSKSAYGCSSPWLHQEIENKKHW